MDARYDRAYSYDHSALITRALSGADARGQTSPPERPYNQISSYDALDHLTNRTTRHWSKTLPYIASDAYTNNRRNGWQYDAAGNLLSNSASQYTYDAAGRMTSISGGNINQFFDGDGQRAKTTEPNVVTYYLRSSVVGEVIEELDSTGNKQRGFIYVGGEVMAEQYQNGAVAFVHKDASGISVRKTNAAVGNVIELSELDPQGADVELEDPYLGNPDYDGRGEGGPMYPGYGNVTSPGNCTLDGVWVPCDMAYRALGSGAAVEAPQNTTRYNYTKQKFEFFRAFADGYYGFIPGGAVYRGNGFFAAHAGWDSEAERLSNATQNIVAESIHWWDLAKIRTDVKTIAARGRCQEFLTKLLEGAGATGGDKAVHTNIVDLFDAVLLQQGFVSQKDVNGRGFSSVRGAVGAPGGAQVRLSNGSNDFKGKLRIQYFAYDALSELTHVAGSKPSTYATGAFSDYHLAKTALDVANEMGTGIENWTLPTVDPKNDPFGKWSDFYHRIVKLNCPRQERY